VTNRHRLREAKLTLDQAKAELITHQRGDAKAADFYSTLNRLRGEAAQARRALQRIREKND
jgi:hypothetical protein